MYAITLQRVSSSKQADNTSIESQETINRATLEQKGFTVVMSFSETKSGRAERETVIQAYEFCRQWNQKKRDKIQVLCIYDWSRWFRNQDLAGYWRTKFTRIGVEVNAATEWITDDDTGQLYVRAFKTAQAQAESIENSKRTKRGMYFTVKKGYHLGMTPRGIIKTPPQPDGKKWIDIHPELGPKYKTAFQRIAAGATPKQVYRDLGGYKTFGGKSTFYTSLRNPIYAGQYHYKSTIDGLPDLNVNLKAIRTVIDLATFRKVQTILEQNATPGKSPSSDQLFWAKKSILCPVCSSRSTSEKSRGRSKVYYYYRCAADATHSRIRQDQAHRIIQTAIKSLQMDQRTIKQAQEMMQDKFKSFRTELSNKEKLLNRQMDQSKDRLQKAVRMFIDGHIDQDDLNLVKSDQQKLQTELTKIRFMKSHQFEIMQNALNMMGSLESAWENLDHSGRASFLQMVFPEGFLIDPDENVCRTTRINAIFNATPINTGDLGLIKIGTDSETPSIPVMGPSQDQSRTIQNDVQVFQLFYYQYLSA